MAKTMLSTHYGPRWRPSSTYRHVDTKRNLRGDWAKSTIRAILKNPTYTGRLGIEICDEVS